MAFKERPNQSKASEWGTKLLAKIDTLEVPFKSMLSVIEKRTDELQESGIKYIGAILTEKSETGRQLREMRVRLALESGKSQSVGDLVKHIERGKEKKLVETQEEMVKMIKEIVGASDSLYRDNIEKRGSIEKMINYVVDGHVKRMQEAEKLIKKLDDYDHIDRLELGVLQYMQGINESLTQGVARLGAAIILRDGQGTSGKN